MRNRRSPKRAETPPGANLATAFERYSSHPQFIGVRMTDANQRGAMGDTILHMAVEAGALNDIETLVKAGADVNAIGDIGNTPLHSAALMGLRDAAERLLDLGADPNVRNDFDETPADVAALANRPELAKLIKRKRRRNK